MSRRLATILYLLPLGAWPATAQDGPLVTQTRVLSDQTLRTSSLSVSACEEDADPAGCVSHELICDRTGVIKLYLAEERQQAGSLAEAARAVLGQTYGSSSVKVEFGSAEPPLSLPLLGLQAVGNDLAGVWDVQFLLGQGERLLDALSRAESPGLTLRFGALALEFALAQSDVPALARFATDCETFLEPEPEPDAKPEPEPDQVAEAEAPVPEARPEIEEPVEPTAREEGLSPARVVRAFYKALEQGDGGAAAELIVPAKRGRGPFSAQALSRFYGGLDEPLRLSFVRRTGENEVLASYRFVAGGAVCRGRALVRTTAENGRTLIGSIRALNGC